MDVNSLPKTVTRQRCGCDLKPGPSKPESSTLTTRLPSHPLGSCSDTSRKGTFLTFGPAYCKVKKLHTGGCAVAMLSFDKLLWAFVI